MFPCICSVIDHRWRRTKKWHTRLQPSVIYYWADARQHGIYSYLFYIIKKQTNTGKAFLFQNLSTWVESRPLPRTPPTLTNTKKAIWRLSVVYTNKAISLVAMRSTRVLIGPRKSCHCQTLARASLFMELELTAKAELNCEICKTWKKCWKNRDGFVIKAALYAEKLRRCLKYCRSWMKWAFSDDRNLCPFWVEDS